MSDTEYVDKEKGALISLKPCPFCGSGVELSGHYEQSETLRVVYIECEGCGAIGATSYTETHKRVKITQEQIEEDRKLAKEADKKAIEAWNRRTP